MIERSGYRAVVIGASAGGMPVLREFILRLPADHALAVIIVQHRVESYDRSWVQYMDKLAAVRVKDADEKESIVPGTVYFAPGNYHLLVETDHTFSLSTEARVNHARPSVNVLFETAAEAYRKELVGVILSGGNDDGALGLCRIKELGGLAVVQAPGTALTPSMPEAAIRIAAPQHILEPADLIEFLIALPCGHNTTTL